MRNYTPLIEWAIATGRLKDGLPRACWVQEVVKDEQAAVASLLAAKAAKRHDLRPPSPWREGVAATADTGEYPAQWLSRADHERIAKARAKRT